MDQLKYSLNGTQSVSLPLEAVDRLLGEADGTLCLLYLYIHRSGGAFDLETASDSLRLGTDALSSAARRLSELGLISPVEKEKALLPPPELPEYDAGDVARRGGQDTGFRAVLNETQRLFGRMLSTQELKQLFGVYDHLKLPPEVMLMLVNHCVTEFKEKYGSGRNPSLRSIEKEGFLWADLEILTLEQTEDYIRNRRRSAGELNHLKRALGLGGREFSASERKYAESWLAMGFSIEALEIAYDRTLVKTGALKWGYMNSIVKSWHEKGLHTPKEIERGDKPPQASRRVAYEEKAQLPQVPEEQKMTDLERMRRTREKLRNG